MLPAAHARELPPETAPAGTPSTAHAADCDTADCDAEITSCHGADSTTTRDHTTQDHTTQDQATPAPPASPESEERQVQAIPAEPHVLRVLFVGNSYTRFNDLPALLESLAESAADGPRIETSVSARGGAGLRQHWERGHAVRELDRVQPTHVVLQDHSLAAFRAPKVFDEYARRFKERVDSVGAQTVFFATWARRPGHGVYTRGRFARSPMEMQARIDALYQEAAHSLSAHFAPVGDAWMLALSRWPDLRLHLNDGSHPSRRGSFLTACVLYGVLTGRSPDQLGTVSDTVDAADQDRLRRLASELLQAPNADGLATLQAPGSPEAPGIGEPSYSDPLPTAPHPTPAP